MLDKHNTAKDAEIGPRVPVRELLAMSSSMEDLLPRMQDAVHVECRKVCQKWPRNPGIGRIVNMTPRSCSRIIIVVLQSLHLSFRPDTMGKRHKLYLGII